MKLDQNDFLTYQLYTASRNPTIKNARIRSWILTSAAFICMTCLFFTSNNDLLGFYFLAASILSLIFYPFYSAWRYKRHYLRYIEDTYKNRFGEECTLEINEEYILTKDKTSEAEINTTEIEEINEIKDFYFVKVRTGVSIIISKVKTDPHDLEILIKRLKELVDKNGIKHNVKLNWKWS